MLDKYRQRWPWFDHLMAAAERYKDHNGDYFGAGITYFSVFALFPIAMVVFAIGGQILVNDAELLADIKRQVTEAVSNPDVAKTVIQLMDQAIASRGTVGTIGLLGAAWSGLGWISNVRAALTEMWASKPPEENFVKQKLGDLVALVGLFLAFVACLALIAVGNSPLTRTLLEKAGLGDVPGLSFVIRGVTLLVTILAGWLLWTFVISRLPRVTFPWKNATRAGLMASVAFAAFAQVAGLIIGSAMKGPAGSTFGPILGIMLFIYFTSRIVLFSTAWAATDPQNQKYVIPTAPDPVVISPVIRPESDPGRAVAAGAAGLAAGLGLGALLRKRR